MTLGQHQEQFTQHLMLLLQEAFKQGYTVRMGECLRPLEMQEIYVKTGRSKTMNSMHIKKCAVDLNLFRDGKVCDRAMTKPLGDWWEALDHANRWGGNWRGLVDSGKSKFVDAPHFERVA